MEPKILETRVVEGCSVSAVHGDLIAEEVDVIVNAANSQLAHGGGLAGAIIRRGGEIIQQESNLLAPVSVGHAVVTSAGRLPCRWVIHAVGPRWGEGDEESKLRSAVRSSLDQATRLTARSLAFPAISTGIFGYPKTEGTRVIVDEVVLWLEHNPVRTVEDIRLTAVDDPTVGLFAASIRNRIPIA